ncbi:Fe-S oxidoreductase, partial [bacterium]|nr:Fe-S oxidoreductase [bacterium]
MTNTAQNIDPSLYAAVTAAIRAEAKRVLETGVVAAVVGYRPGRRPGTALPAIVTDPADADTLIFSPACVNNLALYLTKAKKEVRGKG